MARLKATILQTKTGDSVTIRSAEPTDAEELIPLLRSVMSDNRFTLTEADEFQLTVAEEAVFVQRFLEHPRNVFLVAEVASVLVATLTFEVGWRRRISHTAEFGIGVAAKWRRRGIGEMLLSAALTWAVSAQVERVELHVHANNVGGIGLYQKLGFAHEGTQVRQIKYDTGDYVDSFTMAKWLGEKPSQQTS